MVFKRVMGLFALAMGFFGVVACMVGAYAVWSLGSRLQRANEQGFAMVETGLTATQDRLRAVQVRIKESKITTTEIAQSLRHWGTRKAKEDLVSRLELESREDKLAGYLQTADSWLETSAETIRSIEQILELVNSLGAALELVSLEEVLENITSLRSTLEQTQRAVDRIRAFTADREDESEENRLSRVTKLVGRTLMTIGEIDTRLEEPISRLSELQADSRELKATIRNHISLTTIGGFLVLAWIAAGQIALAVCGWKYCCRSRSIA